MGRSQTRQAVLAVALALGLAACGPGEAGSAVPQRSGALALARAAKIIRVPQDQPTIAAAMAVALAGDTVRLAPGTYRETLALRAGVRVVGGPSTIDAAGLDNGMTADASVKDVSVFGITVQGSAHAGILLDGASVRLEQVFVSGVGGAGMRLLPGSKVEVAGGAFRGSGFAGISADGSHISVTGSELAGNGGQGLFAISSTVDVVDCRVLDNGAAGLRVDDSTAKVEKSLLRGNGGAGNIRIAWGSAATVVGNQIADSRAHGVQVDGGDDPADQRPATARLSRNVVVGSAWVGLFANAGSVRTEANHFDRNGIAGLQAFGANIESKADTFDGNAFGVLATDGASVSASGGTISGNGADAVYASDVDVECANDECTLLRLVQASTYVELQGMRIEANASRAVNVVVGGHVSVRDSILRGNGSEGVFVTSRTDYDLGDGVPRSIDVTGQVAVRGSEIENNGGWCAHVRGASRLEMAGGGAGNSCAGNGAGIRVSWGSSAGLERNRIVGNRGDGVLVDAGEDPADPRPATATLEGNLIQGNSDGVVVGHGSSAELQGNHIAGNAGIGLLVHAGGDLADQRRSSVRMEGNTITGNAAGLQAFNSDVWSESDHLDANGFGAMPFFGATLRASGGSLSGNATHGLWSLDTALNFFCSVPDCTSFLAPQATVHVFLDHMRIAGNGQIGVAAQPGGEVTIRSSTILGNGNALHVNSRSDSPLGNGVVEHVDIAGAMTVRDSHIEGNDWCGLVAGSSRLDMGREQGGGNSCISNRFGGVANLTSPPIEVPAMGNWWGTADAAVIAAMMLGPVDFVPFLTSAP